MITEDIARLIVEANSKGLDVVENELKLIQATLDTTKEAFNKQQITIDQYVDVASRAASRTRELGAAFEISGRAVKDVDDRFRGAGMAALEASRGIEDLQYGFRGVVNNIPGLVMALGGTAGLAAAFSLVSVAVNQLIQHWGELTDLFTNKSPFPNAEHDVRLISRTLEETNKQMKDLESNTKLTADQLKEYNILREFAADTEKKLADEKERQKLIEGFGKDKPSEEERKRAEMLAESLGPHKAQLAADLGGQMRLRAEQELAAYQPQIAAEERRLRGEEQAQFEREGFYTPRRLGTQFERERERLQGAVTRAPDDAKALLERLMTSGKAEDMRKVQGLLGVGADYGEQFAFEQASPEAFKARADEQRDIAGQKQMARLGKDLERQKEKAQADADKVKLDLNTAHLKAIQDSQDIADKAARDRQHDEEKARHKRDQEQRKRDHEQDLRISHEASLLREAYGQENAVRAEQALAGGASEADVKRGMAQAYSQVRGISKQGAERAASEQMERIMLDMSKQGGQGSVLVQAQGKAMLHLQHEQEAQRRHLEQAERDLRRFWDTAGRRGR